MSIIRKFFEPTIEVKKIEILNREESDGRATDVGEDKAGSSSPYIVINDLAFFDSNITDFTLSTEKLLPTIKVTLNDISDGMKNEFLPLDDILSLFLKSDNDDFKGVRQDYRITSLVSTGSKFFLEATLELPEFWVDRIEGFDGSIHSYLQQIAKNMNLGFASNVDNTNDAMYHICPNVSYKELIMNELMKSVYSDFDSFYHIYVDEHYYLNLVEINSLFQTEIEAELESTVDSNYEITFANEKYAEENYASNHQARAANANYIFDYKIINNAGKSRNRSGYRQVINRYNKSIQDYEEVFVESTITKNIGAEMKVLKGEELEDHTTNIRVNRVGTYFPDNVHDNYYEAKIGNSINKEEISKLNLAITYLGTDFSLTNFKKIPVEIMTQDQNYHDMDYDTNEKGVNQSLSGMYVVTGLKYRYGNRGLKIYQEFLAKKREFKKIDLYEN